MRLLLWNAVRFNSHLAAASSFLLLTVKVQCFSLPRLMTMRKKYCWAENRGGGVNLFIYFCQLLMILQLCPSLLVKQNFLVVTRSCKALLPDLYLILWGTSVSAVASHKRTTFLCALGQTSCQVGPVKSTVSQWICLPGGGTQAFFSLRHLVETHHPKLMLWFASTGQKQEQRWTRSNFIWPDPDEGKQVSPGLTPRHPLCPIAFCAPCLRRKRNYLICTERSIVTELKVKKCNKLNHFWRWYE